MYNSRKGIIVIALIFIYSHGFSQQTDRHYLSGTDSKNTVEWNFLCTAGNNSGVWTKIPVPSNWELQGFGTYNYGNDWRDKTKIIKIGEEHGLYKHRFLVPKAWKGKTIKIVFDGSMTDTQVKINGKLAGKIHQGGFNRFKYDISDLLNYGKQNLLEVDVAKRSSNSSVNQAEREADFWIFGGIYRPVFLEISPKQHISRVAIDAKADGSFKVSAFIDGKVISGKIQVELFNINGSRINGIFENSFDKKNSHVKVNGKYEDINSWNPESPTLYKMRVSLFNKGRLIHVVNKRIGFRTVELREHDGIYVNGKRVVFKGVNRHSFWPETGRALNDENHKMDIGLMKEMNMNAVRMSHYCPDERFLDLCDSLGLFVLDELAGWQKGYDTIIGPKRVRELILKDENHPSVVLWDHGNEGGWSFANEKWFHHYDIQKRPVIYPWLNRNGVDTHHYPTIDFAINRFSFGNDIFMPTEFLHGLYDGGLGAGLNDLWKRFKTNPRFAGGFLWVFSDEAVLRTDKGDSVYDSNDNQAPDGILGPHREKEGSFFAIREIWSPVQIEPVVINPQWDRNLFITNDYIFTNLKECKFSWKAIKIPLPGEYEEEILSQGMFKGPDAEPGETCKINLVLNGEFIKADILSMTAFSPAGEEIYTWSWPIQHPTSIVNRYLAKVENKEAGTINISESGDNLFAKIKGIEFTFDLVNGRLIKVNNSRGDVSFSGGPQPVGVKSIIESVDWRLDIEKNLVIEVKSIGFPNFFIWKLHCTGLLELEVSPISSNYKNIDFIGVGFRYPEEKIKSMRWYGKGPYRVWKNRIHGTTMGVWEKGYNNTVTGENFNSLIYPEFKGYHANINWIKFETSESPFTILIETPNIFMQIFSPKIPKWVKGDVSPPFPKEDISFLYEIPAIGTKFTNAEKLGLSGQKGYYKHHSGDDNEPIRVWFDFN